MNNTAQPQRIGPLEAVVSPGQPGGPCIVLFHGYGADANDLAPLAPMLDLPREVTWVFPEGHLEVPIAPGFYGRAWFSIDIDAYENAMRTGKHRELSEKRPPGLDQAKSKASQLLGALKSRHSQLIWGGFSQGAMLSMDLALSLAYPPKALVLMSGALLDRARWTEAVSKVPPTPYFQSHGERDQILAYSGGEELNQLLEKAGWPGEFHSFSGGHEIPLNVLKSLSSFLRHQLRQQK